VYERETDANQNSHSGNGRERTRPGDAPHMSPERLVDAASRYFSADFSNPSRSGCMPSGSFEAWLREGRLPSEELRKHLFGCSECFREYRAAVESHRRAAAGERSRPARGRAWWLRLAPAPVYALVAACILLGAVAFFVVPRGGRGVSEVAVPGSPPTSSSPVLTAVSPTPAPDAAARVEPGATATAPTTPEIAEAGRSQRPRKTSPSGGVVLIDLAAYTVLRTDERAPEAFRGLTLPPAVNRLRILLPEGSPRGVYRVALVDAFGKSVGAERIAEATERKLEVSIDTRKLSGRRCRLRVSHGEDAPDYYPINVGGR
jgi:hypothetical protein